MSPLPKGNWGQYSGSLIVGCTISSNAIIDQRVDNRLAKASKVLGWLFKRVWNNEHLKISTNINAFRVVVLTMLLYGSESWLPYCYHLKAPWTFTPTLPPNHLRNFLEQLHHQHRGPWASKGQQHGSHFYWDMTALAEWKPIAYPRVLHTTSWPLATTREELQWSVTRTS